MTKLDTATPNGACYAVFRKNNKILFVYRSNTDWMKDHYGLAAGKLEKDETFSQGVIREAKEEVGVSLDQKNLKQILTIHRRADDGNTWVDVFFEIKKWIGDPFNAEPELHGTIEWLNPKNLPQNVIPMIKFAIKQIEAGNSYAEYGWS